MGYCATVVCNKCQKVQQGGMFRDDHAKDGEWCCCNCGEKDFTFDSTRYEPGLPEVNYGGE